MPKKVNSVSKSTKAKNDFHFIVIISVFAALTIFAANYMAQAKQNAMRQTTLPVAQIDIVKPSIKPSTKPKTKATPVPTTKPYKNLPPTPRPYIKPTPTPTPYPTTKPFVNLPVVD
jgi:hypothetical protein